MNYIKPTKEETVLNGAGMIKINRLLEKGIPVIMVDGAIIEFCENVKNANSLILNIDDFPELKEMPHPPEITVS